MNKIIRMKNNDQARYEHNEHCTRVNPTQIAKLSKVIKKFEVK